MGLFKPKVPTAKAYEAGRIYDYSTREGRIATAEWLFNQAKVERSVRETEWKKYQDYYNFAHDVSKEISQAENDLGIPWTPPCVPDPYIMVESQIIPDIPQPEFHGRDDDLDSERAKKREFAVRYIIEANRLSDMNTSNEKRLRKFGDAFWKAYYDATMPFGEKTGNIRIKDISPEDIYPDPTSGPGGLQNGEYVNYVYSVHKNKFWREYHSELKRQNLTLDDIQGFGYRESEGLLDPFTHPSSVDDDLVQVLEHWFRQPFDTPEAPAGAIGCTMQAGGFEIRYIPNYWKNTGRQCQLFPFVQSWYIRDETSFWNKSELEPIIPLVDAADRELATAILNDAMTSNDVVLVEEGALPKGEEFSNTPGKVIRVNQGRLGGIARLGGLSSGVQSLNAVKWIQEQIQRTNRNYDTNNGQETSRVTTASGLLQLRSDADGQRKIKKADRDAGFRRLYELLDWLALEFWDEDTLLFIGAKNADEEPQALTYNSNEFAKNVPGKEDVMTGEKITDDTVYYPTLDVTITTGDGLSKNPATTVEVLDKLAASTVTEDNWRLLAAELEYLDIPQKQEIISVWKKKFETNVNGDSSLNSELSELIEALKADPELRAALEETVMAKKADESVGQNPAEFSLPVQSHIQMPMTAYAEQTPVTSMQGFNLPM